MLDCDFLRESLKAGSLPEGEEVSAHLTSCEGCRELLASAGVVGHGLTLASEPLPAVPAFSLPEDRGLRDRLRSLATPARALLVLGFVLVVSLLQLVRHGLGDVRFWPTALLSVFVGAAVALFLAPLGKPRPSGPRLLTTAALAVLPVAVAFGLLGARAGAPAGLGSAEGALACFAYGAALTAPVLGLLFLLERRSKVPLFESALAGASAGAAANIVLEMHCVNEHPAHLLLGHATLVVLWVVVAAVASQRAPRSV